MRYWFPIAAAFLATPALAQDRMNDAGCAAGWGLVAQTVLQETDGDAIPAPHVADDGWCAFEDVTVPVDSNLHIAVQSLRWRAMDMGRFVDEGLPPRSLEIVLTGGHVVPQAGDPFISWALGVQATRDPFNATLDLRWDEVQNAILIQDVSIDFPGADALTFKGRVDGVDLSSVQAMQTSIGSAGLTDLDVSITSEGLFETYLLLPMGYALFDPAGDPPEAQFRAHVTEMRETIATLPDTLLPERSKDAANALLDELPSPTGTLRIQVQTDAPIGMARLAPIAMGGAENVQDAVLAALEGVVLGLHWTSTGGTGQ